MKALKHIIVITTLALGVAAPAAIAQDSAPGKGRQHQGPQGPQGPRGGFDMTTPLLKGITLTDDQQKKVDAIKADMQKQRESFASLAPEERMSKGRELMQSTQGKIRAVLTADQQKTFDQNVKEMQSRFQGKGAPGSKGPPGGKSGRGGKGGGAPKADAEE